MGYDEEVTGGLNSPKSVPPPGIILRTPHEVIAELANEGAPVPLGWDPLDRQMRGGGARAGRLIVLGGAPGAGKTTVLCQVALHLSKSYPVYTLFSDEGDEGAATRIGVQLGVGLEKIESERGAAALEIEVAEGERSIFMVKPDQFESTPEKIVEHISKTHDLVENVRAVVLLDSIQTIAKVFANGKEDSPRLPVQRLMTMTRQWAIAHRLLFLMTSRSNRAAYRSKKADMNSEDMASFAESSDIEFAADVAAVFSLPNEDTGVIKVRIVKNRLKGTMKSFSQRYDEGTGRMLEVDIPESEDRKERARIEAVEKSVRKLAEEAEAIVRKRGGLTGSQLTQLIGGRKSNLITALRGLEAQGVLQSELGSRGAVVWSVRT